MKRKVLGLIRDARIGSLVRRSVEKAGFDYLTWGDQMVTPGEASVFVLDDGAVAAAEVGTFLARLRTDSALSKCSVVYLLQGNRVARTDVPEAWAAGVDIILPKPFNEQELMWAIGRSGQSGEPAFLSERL